ncbi:phosphoesterase RecJ domain-containing protein [Virgibacillus subterraneus]|uniref:Phosphoesterase RecJ domain-containing protein n=1 Tax=Virgibacillus subterraneus TaxID=621109 RepID=A0A1H9DCU8_9BACI|nr:bifunctional oligoribonuclease/PAP phosphatase NrnA [Virgibacillus subterraneus]SEQ11325.1 phosphoesterase RecJ domain-containing protein [Virgibacillus subterraneus]
MSLEKIIQSIKEFETIIIHRHVRPDPDAYGSQAGLKEIILQAFPKKDVFIVGEEEPSLNFLVRMDGISDETYNNALVIVCDTANAARICDQRYELGSMLIKIDHHPNVDEYGDLMWVDTTSSSTSEMIYDLFLYGINEGLELNDEAARLLYAGIVGDTGRFLFPSTSQKTFQHAAELITYNFDRSSLYDGLYSIKDNIARLRGYILQHFQLTSSGMSTIKLTRNILNEFQVDPSDTGQLVGVLGEIEGIKAWAFFIEETDLIRVRLRSKGPIINEIAGKYNGGGHPMAAGASVNSWDETKSVIDDLEKACLAYT